MYLAPTCFICRGCHFQECFFFSQFLVFIVGAIIFGYAFVALWGYVLVGPTIDVRLHSPFHQPPHSHADLWRVFVSVDTAICIAAGALHFGGALLGVLWAACCARCGRWHGAGDHAISKRTLCTSIYLICCFTTPSHYLVAWQRGSAIYRMGLGFVVVFMLFLFIFLLLGTVPTKHACNAFTPPILERHQLLVSFCRLR